jgi:hypothetical protein
MMAFIIITRRNATTLTTGERRAAMTIIHFRVTAAAAQTTKDVKKI